MLRLSYTIYRIYKGEGRGGGLYQYKWMEWHCLTSPTCIWWVVLCNSVHPLNQYLIWHINRRRVHWFMSSDRMFYNIYITSFASCIVLLTIYLWKKTHHQNLPKTSKEKSEKQHFSNECWLKWHNMINE